MKEVTHLTITNHAWLTTLVLAVSQAAETVRD